MDHNILLKLVDYHGIRGIVKDWYCSYLDNRKQYVTLSGSNLCIKPIWTGVPQGPVSQLLVFLVYINDLCSCVKYSQTYHITNDTNILQSHRSLKTLVKRINVQLKILSQYIKPKSCLLMLRKQNWLFPTQVPKALVINLS